MSRTFTSLASKCAQWVGTPWAFLLASGGVLLWAVLGPAYHFSDTWELVINTATTIITFLMVFLIQNTQNRDARALHLKLDELIYALRRADDQLLGIEQLGVEELDVLAEKYKHIKEKFELQRDKKLKSRHKAQAQRVQRRAGIVPNTMPVKRSSPTRST